MRVFHFVFAAFLLLFAGGRAPAQEVFLEREGQFLYPPNLTLGPQNLLLGMTIGSLKGHPLGAAMEAENRRVDAHGQTIVTRYRSKIFRDSEGRTRLEWTITPLERQPDPGRDSVEIYDAPTRTLIHLTPSTKMAWRSHFPTPAELKKYACDPQDLPPIDPKVLHDLPPPPKVLQIELAHDLVDGWKVRHGRETVSTPPSPPAPGRAYRTVTDYWFSEELQYFVLVKRTGPGQSQHIIRLSDLRQAEPDPALFAIPAGYTVSPGRQPDKEDCRPKAML